MDTHPPRRQTRSITNKIRQKYLENEAVGRNEINGVMDEDREVNKDTNDGIDAAVLDGNGDTLDKKVAASNDLQITTGDSKHLCTMKNDTDHSSVRRNAYKFAELDNHSRSKVQGRTVV